MNSPTPSPEFLSQYQLYEQAFMAEARRDFDQQSFANRVQFLRGVFRYLLMNRLLATHGHTIQTVLQNRYIDSVRGVDRLGAFVSWSLKRIIGNLQGADQIIIDAKRTMYDIFPDVKVKKGLYIESAIQNFDILGDRKFGLAMISKAAILEYMKKNNIQPHSLAAAQERLAPRMSRIKKSKD